MELNCTITFQVPPYQGIPTGLWANKHIPAGSLVLSETPILKITTLSPSHSNHAPAPALAKVPEIFTNSQNQDLPTAPPSSGLAGTEPGFGQAHLVQAIIRGNNLVGQSTWVLPGLISRIKHSYLPNAVNMYYQSPTPRLQIIAMRPILPDEEITISYCLPTVLMGDVGERRGVIWKVFGFVCDCARRRLEDRPHTVGIVGARGWYVRLWIAEGQDIGAAHSELSGGEMKKVWSGMKKWDGRWGRSEGVRWDVNV